MTATDKADFWHTTGKTDNAYPRGDTGRFDNLSGWGWSVDWGAKDEKTIVFAHLIQDEKQHRTSPGM